MKLLKGILLFIFVILITVIIGGVSLISWLFELSVGETLGLLIILGIAGALFKK